MSRLEPVATSCMSQALYNNCWLEISYTDAVRKRTQGLIDIIKSMKLMS
ncbi:MAG: hypothetical protein K9K38_05710 [Rhodoferax sp.]|nr:hypothetical protein [Rhodoferax sp.]